MAINQKSASLSVGVKEQEWIKEAKEGGWVYHYGNAAVFVPSRKFDDLQLFDSIWAARNSSVAALRERITQLETINEPVTGEPNCD